MNHTNHKFIRIFSDGNRVVLTYVLNKTILDIGVDWLLPPSQEQLLECVVWKHDCIGLICVFINKFSITSGSLGNT